MIETETLRDKIIGKLTATKGEELEITCNLTNQKQLALFMEEIGHRRLGSRYIIDRSEMFKRATNSYMGRTRTDLVEIGKTPEFSNQKAGFDDQ